MGFGGSTPLPEPEPVPPPPQEDDPNSIRAAEEAIARAQGQDGIEAHLLAGPGGDTSPAPGKRKTLSPSAGAQPSTVPTRLIG